MTILEPAVADYLFHDSPLQSSRNRLILSGIAAVLVVLAILGWTIGLGNQNLLPVFVWVPYTILGSIIGYFIIAFLDRERRIRPFHFVIFFSVFLITAPVAALFNTISPAPLVTVGSIEEGFKILPVLLLALFVPNLIRTRKDGIVYGALAGMAFNILEVGLYIAHGIDKFGLMGALYQQSTRFSLFGLGGHIIWSAFVGLGIGYAAESKAHGWAKWKGLVICYLVAAVSHSVFDLGLSMVGVLAITFVETLLNGTKLMDAVATMGTVPGPFRDGMRYSTYLLNIVLIIILFVQIKRSFDRENTLQIEELSTEDNGVITSDELTKLKGERLFAKRRYADFGRRIGDKIVQYQNLLAMQKHVATQDGLATEKVKPVAELRHAIQSLRTRTTQ